MDKKTITKLSFINAAGTVFYVLFVSLFMKNAEQIFGEMEETIVGPMIFLLLFVISASITGGLILGKPLMLYLDKQKREAIRLFVCTLAWLILFIIIFLLSKLV